MWFLLRLMFWLGLVLVLLPRDKTPESGKLPQIGASEAVQAATAAVSDVSQFCKRQPAACEVGGQAATVIGQRATDGARKLYKIITDKKICIGVIDHHSLQVERPEEIADHIRRALKYIPAERLVLSSDCGMGREGMSRRHAFYKIVSLVLGTNMVRKELGLPQAECLAADSRYSLVVPAK
jgi:hypothetical protein